ncbi:NAD(+) diphosphatase [Luteimonas aestuarii]|uniref:NAD(+) diphosphatase n=1 Tax=Luteimonas aestuarii TaxID=453837 RepID=A0A4V3AM68_9GAMM|nr:NAD(+) diphosphatase [Luteimonas aestuarii]TDK22699.1 NAD(+) diphosphatase [Luteimonas aestuarii]
MPSPSFAFIDGALDRAEHVRSDSARLATLWPDARVLLLDADGRAQADDAGALRASTGARHPDRSADAVLLGLDGGQAWFALPLLADESGDSDQRVDLRTAAATWPVRDATAFAQARAVLHWRARHRYCGACGGALRYDRAGWLGRCTQCHLEHYPRTDPAVIVAVTDGERLLLGRQANWPARRYSTLAGFVEPGETLEQTVVREVFEESAVRVRSCRYLASQPWPFPSSLMLGFVAEAETDVPRVNDVELEDARWFTRDEVGAALRGETKDAGLLVSPRLSISRWLIETWHASL